MFSNESESLCKFKQGVSFSVTDLWVPIRRAVELKLCFCDFAKFLGTDCPVKGNVYIYIVKSTNAFYITVYVKCEVTLTSYHTSKLTVHLFGNLDWRCLQLNRFNTIKPRGKGGGGREVVFAQIISE